MSRAILITLSWLALQPAAWAQTSRLPDDEDAQARIYFQNGRYHFENGHYEQAINAWQMSYDLSKRPQLLYNIASAQERLGDWQEALDTLNEYRSHADPEDWQSIERRIISLERRIAEEVTENQVEETSISPSLSIEDPAPRSLLGLSLTGGGVAAIGAGLFLGTQARAAGIEAQEGCRDSGTGLLCSESASAMIGRQRSLAIGADISSGLGLLATAGGIVVILRPPPLGEGLGLSPTLNGVVLRGQF